MIIALTLLLFILLCLTVGLPTFLLANRYAETPGHPGVDDLFTAFIIVCAFEAVIAGLLFVCYQAAAWLLLLLT